jgi:hypothetical protein
MLSYPGDIKYYLVVADLNYVQADLFDVSSYYYLHRNSLVSYYSFILFYRRPINNIK